MTQEIDDDNTRASRRGELDRYHVATGGGFSTSWASLESVAVGRLSSRRLRMNSDDALK